jgi:hypothetical protein
MRQPLARIRLLFTSPRKRLLSTSRSVNLVSSWVNLVSSWAHQIAIPSQHMIQL